jgi:SAM-dependent methyltransferase
MPDPDHAPGNARQADFWTSGPGVKWAALHEALDGLFAQVTAELLARAQPRPGEVALDIGWGAGDSTLAAADRIGTGGHTGGHVEGLDISATLLAVARRRAGKRPDVTFTLADAQTHPFGADGADLILSRFGMMFFSDPAMALGNLRRALKPGGRIVFVTWADLARNPWNREAKAAGVARLGAVPADLPREPGQFAFAEIDYVTDLLAGAGFGAIAAEECETLLRVSGRAEQAAALATEIGPVSRLMREKGGTEADRRLIAEDLAGRFRRFETLGGVEVPAVVNFFAAVRR